MNWLIEDIKKIFAELKRPETWFTLGLLSGFGLLSYMVARFAFQTDFVLRDLYHMASSCRELSNGPIIFLFCGMIFFALAVVVTLGEFQQYFDSRERAGHYEAKRALFRGIAWGSVAIAISIAALLFFNAYCR